MLCALLSLMCLASCDSLPDSLKGEETSVSDTQPADNGSLSVLRIPCAPSDSLNPFFVESLMNSSFVGLVFRSLYKIDSAGARINDIAVSETVSDTAARVTFAPDSVFSDGSLMTARDVVYSFNLAKNSPLYAQELSGISQAFITGDYSLEFTLASPDIFSIDSLMFPVAKSGTADTAQSVPAGSGQYMYSSEGDTRLLTENPFAAVTAGIKKIVLTDIEDDASLVFMLETRQLDACFSELTEGEASRIDAATNAVAMNNLVFAGFNPAREEFLRPEIRRAISLLLDRTEISENAFFSRADACVLPVQPRLRVLAESSFAQSLSPAADDAGALQLLSDAGFSGVSEYGIRYGGVYSMQYTLLYCSDTSFKTACAEYISQKLTSRGIVITLKGLPLEEYKTALANGEYDIYIGEIKLPYNMSLSSFFSPDGVAFCGACMTEALANSYAAWRAGTVSSDTFFEAFYGEMPFVPLCFRSGVLCYSRSIKSAVTASKQNPYENIADWTT